MLQNSSRSVTRPVTKATDRLEENGLFWSLAIISGQRMGKVRCTLQLREWQYYYWDAKAEKALPLWSLQG